jgi:hypothetical protein
MVMRGLLYSGAALLGCMVVGWVVAQLMFRKQRGLSREDFVTAFSGTGVATEIPEAVYDFYKRGVVFKEFSIAPDDTYEDALHECEEDVEDDARYLMKELGLKLPSLEVQQQWSEQVISSRAKRQSVPSFSPDSARLLRPIQTVRDMVLWLDWVRQHQDTTVSG